MARGKFQGGLPLQYRSIRRGFFSLARERRALRRRSGVCLGVEVAKPVEGDFARAYKEKGRGPEEGCKV